MIKKRERISAAVLRNIRPLRTVRGAHIVLKLFASPSPTGRFAVVVGSSVAKRATQRNAIRRRIYEWIRGARPPLQSRNILIIVLPPFAQLEKHALAGILESTFLKTGIHD